MKKLLSEPLACKHECKGGRTHRGVGVTHQAPPQSVGVGVKVLRFGLSCGVFMARHVHGGVVLLHQVDQERRQDEGQEADVPGCDQLLKTRNMNSRGVPTPLSYHLHREGSFACRSIPISSSSAKTRPNQLLCKSCRTHPGVSFQADPFLSINTKLRAQILLNTSAASRASSTGAPFMQ